MFSRLRRSTLLSRGWRREREEPPRRYAEGRGVPERGTAAPARRWRRERGSMAIEVVALAPILVIVLLFVVAVGKWVDRKADVEAIARDAARAASLERDFWSAQEAADTVLGNAEDRLYDGASCESVDLSGSNFEAGGMVEAVVTCQLPWDGFAPIGLNGSVEIGALAESPLDQWRRTG